MLKKIIFITAIFLSTSMIANADTIMDEDNSKACDTIANACLNGGYKDKAFWHDCMKPVILGKSVNNVNIDMATIKTCRRDKIKQLKDQLQQFREADK